MLTIHEIRLNTGARCLAINLPEGLFAISNLKNIKSGWCFETLEDWTELYKESYVSHLGLAYVIQAIEAEKKDNQQCLKTLKYERGKLLSHEAGASDRKRHLAHVYALSQSHNA